MTWTMPYVAPAGTRLALRDIGVGLARGWMDGSADANLGQALCRLSDSAQAWPFVSGRAAMTFALRVIAQHAGSGRNQVVVPAYTCYSVPAAIERAGLVPVACDIDPRSASMDMEHLVRLVTGPVVAVISANLFGIPNRLDEIEEVTRRHGVLFFDDAAQAMGARLAGRPVGGFGELGLYSFDKGKNISTMQGGALLARNGPLLEALGDAYERLADSNARDTAATVAKLPPYAVLLNPWAYAIVRRLPMIRLGETRYEMDYPLTRLSRGLAGLAHRQVGRLSGYQAVRVVNAAALRRELQDISSVHFVEPPASAEPVFPRFPIRADSRGMRDRMMVSLNRQGIGATGFYPQALVDVPEVARRMPVGGHSFAGAREFADTILTLPTHAHCPPGLATRIREAIRLA